GLQSIAARRASEGSHPSPTRERGTAESLAVSVEARPEEPSHPARLFFSSSSPPTFFLSPSVEIGNLNTVNLACPEGVMSTEPRCAERVGEGTPRYSHEAWRVEGVLQPWLTRTGFQWTGVPSKPGLP